MWDLAWIEWFPGLQESNKISLEHSCDSISEVHQWFSVGVPIELEISMLLKTG